MFVDASAICSILPREEDGDRLYVRLRSAPSSVTSAMAFRESAVAVSRRLNTTPTQAGALVRSLLGQTRTEIVAVPPEAAELAVEAFERFGKGRHRAALNLGDCFSYACARHHGLPLLFKGDDFPRTDIASALAAD